MNNTLSRLAGLLGVAVLVYFLISLVANISQLADAADRVYAGAGRPAFLVLLGICLIALVTPIVYYLRLPKPLIPPEASEGPEHEAYLVRVRSELRSHRNLPDLARAQGEIDIDAAMLRLGAQADAVIRAHAATVFIGTALMQSGRLDGLVVLTSQARMVWKIAHIYYRRPSPRQLLYLYSNVAASTLIAENLSGLDLGEFTAPIVSAAAPSLIGAVPGLQAASNLLVNSLANGASNSFLTLRVGLMARSYCASLVHPDRKQVRHSATLGALVMFGEIVQNNAGAIASAVWQRIGSTATGIASATARGVRNAASATASGAADAANATVEAISAALESTGRQLKEFAEAASQRASGMVKKVGRAPAQAPSVQGVSTEAEPHGTQL